MRDASSLGGCNSSDILYSLCSFSHHESDSAIMWYHARFLRRPQEDPHEFRKAEGGAIESKDKPSSAVTNPLSELGENMEYTTKLSNSTTRVSEALRTPLEILPSLSVQKETKNGEDVDEEDEEKEMMELQRSCVMESALLEEGEGPRALPIKALRFICAPLDFLFYYTCVDCEKGGYLEKWYPLTIIISLMWVSLFSITISSIVEPLDYIYSGVDEWLVFGLLLYLFRAEIPDTLKV